MNRQDQPQRMPAVTRRQFCANVGLASLAGMTMAHAAPERPTSAGPELQAGVVFFLPGTIEETLAQLEQVRTDGFNQVEVASWAWTLPTPGSDLRRRAETLLDWCDRNGVRVWLLQNVQYGSGGEGGTIEQVTADPYRAGGLLTDWADTVQGHPCVVGVLLGNEVGPADAGAFASSPRFLAGFRDYLKEIHLDVAALNRRWETAYASFSEVPAAGLPERSAIDVRRYCRRQFGRFYATLVERFLAPKLGAIGYASKTSLDPFLQRDIPAYTVCSWDDLLANFPLADIKLACDTVGRRRPVYNSELHLYHDDYAYGPSPELSRYRYFTSALLGEWMTSSFAWGKWNKPEIRAIHQATRGILADLRRLEPVLRRFNAGSSEILLFANEGGERSPRTLQYAHLSAAGRPWRFVLDGEVPRGDRQTLVLNHRWLTASSVEEVARWQGRIVCVGPLPEVDEWDKPLVGPAYEKLRARARVVADWADLPRVLAPHPLLLPSHRQIVEAHYLNWSPEKGHFRYPVPYPAIEMRLLSAGRGQWDMVLINHREVACTDRLPLPPGGNVVVEDLVAQRPLVASTLQTWAPYELKMLHVRLPG